MERNFPNKFINNVKISVGVLAIKSLSKLAIEKQKKHLVLILNKIIINF